MLVNGFATSLHDTIDRLMILAFLGRKELGYYAVAILAANIIDFIPTAVHNIYLPRIMKHAGEHLSHEHMGMFWLKPLYAVSFILPIIVGLGWLLSPVVIQILLPKYLPGVFALKILIFGMCFASIPLLTRNLFIALNKQFRVLGAYLVSGLLCLGLNYVFLSYGLGITGVALSTTLTFLFLGIMFIYMALSLLGRKTELFKVVATVYSPSLIIALLLLLLEYVSFISSSIGGEISMTVLKVICYLLFLVIGLYLFNKQTRAISQLIAELREARS